MVTLLTAEQVLAKMNRDDKFAVNLLLALFNRQEADEQTTGCTRHENGVGFNGVDAPILTSFAEQAIRTRAARKEGRCDYSNDLSPKQIALLRKKLAKYARQLTDLTNAAAAARSAAPDLADHTPMAVPPSNEVCITIPVADSPWGNEVQFTHHPLPAHLQHRRDSETTADPLCVEGAQSDAPFHSSAIVACAGGFRFKTAKKYWRDGGQQEFNEGVDRWITARNGDGAVVRVGGGPSVDCDDDPFAG